MENSLRSSSPSKTFSSSLSNFRVFEGTQVTQAKQVENGPEQIPELTVKVQSSEKCNEPEQTPKSAGIYFEETKEIKDLRVQ
jgi:hypothetical protein